FLAAARLERVDLLLLNLQRGHDHAEVAVEIDAVVAAVDREAVRLILDDEAEVLRAVPRVRVRGETHLERLVAQRLELGLVEVVDLLLELRARDRTAARFGIVIVADHHRSAGGAPVAARLALRGAWRARGGARRGRRVRFCRAHGIATRRVPREAE